MGFLPDGNRPSVKPGFKTDMSIRSLHRLECRACPLNHANVNHPKMSATGCEDPLVYMLGEAPGKTEDLKARQFVGRAGRLVRRHIPEEWFDHIRWNNVIRTRPPDNRNPLPIEIECCRPSIVSDIEATEPLAIFGFGNVPLKWATGQDTISKWNGRKVPVRIGKHTCWFFPMYHPAYVSRTIGHGFTASKTYRSDIEHIFVLNLLSAFEQVENLSPPDVHDRARALQGVSSVTGHKTDDLARVTRELEWFGSQPLVGWDYETNGLRPYADGAKILTLAVSSGDRSFAFPLGHSQAGWDRKQLKLVKRLVKNFLRDTPAKKTSHNLAFELEWTGFFFGKEAVRGSSWGDSMAQAFTLDERLGHGKPGCLSLDFLCLQHFGLLIKGLSSVDVRRLDTTDLSKVLPYNAVDAKYHKLLNEAQTSRLLASDLFHVNSEQVRRIPTMVLTQLKGLPVHAPTVKKFWRKYSHQLKVIGGKLSKDRAVQEFEQDTGIIFAPSNNEHVSKVLREYLDVKLPKTKRGYSVDKDVLKEIDHNFAKLMIRWRVAAKRKSTYVEPLRKGSSILHPDGKLHPILNTTRARTGRLTSQDPNEQNWPHRDKVGRKLRCQIKPAVNFVICAFDYSGIEVCCIAMASKDKTLVVMLRDRYDMHKDWAERLAYAYPKWVGGKKFINDKDVMSSKRTEVKNRWVFPQFYGAHPTSCARNLEIPDEICYEQAKILWDMFPGVKKWQDRLVTFYDEHGYVECLTGRRRRAPISKNQLINSPIQGTAADIVVDSMNRLSERGEDDMQAILNIHDDLSFSLEKRIVEERAEIVLDHMLVVPYDFVNVPISVGMSMGPTWGDQESVGKFSSDRWKV